MPKILFNCEQCGSQFGRYPSSVRFAEQNGQPIRFCSQKCLGTARSAGKVKAKKKTGKTITCAVCGKKEYRSAYRLKRTEVHLCSEACRMAAFEQKKIDRTAPRPERKLGEEIQCCICGETTYRKRSMIDRNINKTCGSRACVSAYSRSLWGLPPRTEDERRIRKGPSRRKTNFTAKQRADWIEDKCAMCGATDNLCLDHIIPVCAGGDSTRDNAQTLCQPCNIWKGNHIDRLLAQANGNPD